MLFLCLFLLLSGLAAWGVVQLGGGWLLAVLAFLLVFVLVQLGWLGLFALLVRKVDLTQEGAVQDRRAAFCAEKTCEYLLFLAGAIPNFVGLDRLPKERSFLLVSNHRSLFDPLLLMWKLAPWHIAFITKPSNYNYPFFRSIGNAGGYLTIDRENDREALKTILRAADYLRRGVCSIGIYPEGTRTRTGELLPFHHGSFKAAQRGGAPVAVCCVSGTEKLRRGLLLRPHRVRFEVLELIPAERVKAMSTKELAEYCRARIEEGLKGEVS